jgi:hypothetical protein
VLKLCRQAADGPAFAPASLVIKRLVALEQQQSFDHVRGMPGLSAHW